MTQNEEGYLQRRGEMNCQLERKPERLKEGREGNDRKV